MRKYEDVIKSNYLKEINGENYHMIAIKKQHKRLLVKMRMQLDEVLIE